MTIFFGSTFSCGLQVLYPCHPQTHLPNPLVLDDLLFGESTSTKEASEGLLKSKFLKKFVGL
jgi:hypothetical protein